jgi:adenylate kinase family enzyme
MIIGGPGSGKTWLAERLGRRYELPIHAVDDEVWDPLGNQRAPDDIDARVRRLTAQEKWIIEGGNSRTYANRVHRADAVIRMVPPVWQRLYRVLRRDGIRIQLLRWTLRYDEVFGPRDRLALESGLGTATCIEIGSNAELHRLLRVGIEGF